MFMRKLQLGIVSAACTMTLRFAPSGRRFLPRSSGMAVEDQLLVKVVIWALGVLSIAPLNPKLEFKDN